MPLAMPSTAEEKVVDQSGPDFATYQELADLEHEFDEVEDEIIREQYNRTKPLYEKRRSLISRIENFWSLALELAPQEIDQFVQPSDSGVFAECLKDIEVSRFELDSNAKDGSPRSFSVKFTFGPNEWFADEVLEKKFWYRHSSAHGSGLVSEPVKIQWKAGKDLTQGLTDAAVKLWDATSKLSAAEKAKSITKLSEYKKLAALLEENDRSSVSFFTFFAFVAEHVYVSAEESLAAKASDEERRKKRANGEEVSEDDDEAAEEKTALAVAEWEDVEVCPHGAELATVIADEFWPNALKFFVESNQMADGPDDMDIESGDGFESEDDDEADDPIDIRGLVGDTKRKGKASSPGSASPPANKNRKRE